jgi:hypothetical protein
MATTIQRKKSEWFGHFESACSAGDQNAGFVACAVFQQMQALLAEQRSAVSEMAWEVQYCGLPIPMFSIQMTSFFRATLTIFLIVTRPMHS